MKFIFSLVFIFFSLNAHSKLNDVSYIFEPSKLASANKSFDFYRTFVDYFYLLEKANSSEQKFIHKYWGHSGWCFGDTHLENFGTLLNDQGESIFTVNDFDDAGPCPVILDFFRLAVSAKLFDSQIQLENIFYSYQNGLLGLADPIPLTLISLLKKSIKKGLSPDKKDISKNQFIRSSESSELTRSEKNNLKTLLQNLNNNLSTQLDWLDGLKTTKNNGGSFGLTRYQMLLQNDENLLHLELKEQVTPSIYPVLRADILPSVTEKVSTSLLLTQGSQASIFYGTTSIQQFEMLIRPRFGGQSSLKAADYSISDLEKIIAHEANLLGLLQRKYSLLKKEKFIELSSEDLSNFIENTQEMTLFIQNKFKILK